jgi:hypothetical protein
MVTAARGRAALGTMLPACQRARSRAWASGRVHFHSYSGLRSTPQMPLRKPQSREQQRRRRSGISFGLVLASLLLLSGIASRLGIFDAVPWLGSEQKGPITTWLLAQRALLALLGGIIGSYLWYLMVRFPNPAGAADRS